MEKPLAVISGGTGYIGAAVTQELTASGWEVAVLSRRANPGLYECDVTDEQAVRETIAAIVQKFGKIDACIHAATVPLKRVGLLSVSPTEFELDIHTAARGALLLAKECMPHMEHGATFIGITSQAIEPGLVQPLGTYLPAKYALRGMLRVLASETREAGICVYAVAPSFLPGGLNSDLPEKVQNFIALKSGTNADSPKELGELIRKLCMHEVDIPSGSSIAFPSLSVSPL
jgi:NAD(P)-dependent dehydrogenase (short-subunit alcohol dehydrogenase family)